MLPSGGLKQPVKVQPVLKHSVASYHHLQPRVGHEVNNAARPLVPAAEAIVSLGVFPSPLVDHAT